MRVETRRILAGVLAVACATAVVAVVAHDAPRRTTPGASLEATSSCADALVLAAPGAGQGAADDPGATLRPLTDAIAGAAGGDGRSVETQVAWVESAGASALRGKGTARTPADQAVTRSAWKAWRAPSGPIFHSLDASLQAALASCPD